VPIISVIIGEGGSGGAVALATADKILMLENSIYSVISPEGCASILWKVEGYDEIAANSLKITSEDLQKLKVVDKVIKEPIGGAHRNPSDAFKNLKVELKKVIEGLRKKSGVTLSKERKQKFLKFGSNFSL
jgi:acetyl-CoA carboxylase carboxyl transferase subunit alpha